MRNYQYGQSQNGEVEISMRKIFIWCFTGIFGLIMLLTLMGSWYTVDQGERAVVLRLGAVIGEAGPGLHFKTPWINSVHMVTVQNQTRRYTPLEAYSRDQQPAQLAVSVTYNASDPRRCSARHHGADQHPFGAGGERGFLRRIRAIGRAAHAGASRNPTPRTEPTDHDGRSSDRDDQSGRRGEGD